MNTPSQVIEDMSRIRPDRVKERRLELRLSQGDLAKAVGVTQQAIQQIEDGKTARPRKLKELAEALQCTSEWLLGGSKAPDRPEGVGLIDRVSAGQLAEIIDNYQPGDADEWVDYPAKHSKVVALRVKGNSMNRVSPDGSIIIVDLLQREMTSNRLYIVKIGEEATFKRYRANPPRLEPDSTEAHDAIYLEGVDHQPLGRVLRTMMDFE